MGKTVQVVPHVTDAIIEWVQQVARKPVDDSGRTPQVCVIELGGTIGDIEGMPFIEAFRQFQFRIGASNFCNIHLSLVPEVRKGKRFACDLRRREGSIHNTRHMLATTATRQF